LPQEQGGDDTQGLNSERGSVTLEEIDSSLPCGLHDAQIVTIKQDFSTAMSILEVDVWVRPRDAPASDPSYRRGIIQFSNSLLITIAMPENERIIGVPGNIWFVWERIERGQFPEKIARAISDDALCYSLYILEWESSIQVAAADVSFTWAVS